MILPKSLSIFAISALLRGSKIPQKPHFANEINTEFFFDGGGHLLGELPDIRRGAAGIVYPTCFG